MYFFPFVLWFVGFQIHSVFVHILLSNVACPVALIHLFSLLTKQPWLVWANGLKGNFLNRITMTPLWAQWRLKSPASRLLTQSFIQALIKENIKTPRHWPLCGEFTADRLISPHNGPVTRKCFHLMTSSCENETPTYHNSKYFTGYILTLYYHRSGVSIFVFRGLGYNWNSSAAVTCAEVWPGSPFTNMD